MPRPTNACVTKVAMPVDVAPSVSAGMRCYIADDNAAWLPVYVESVDEAQSVVTVRIQRPRKDESSDHDESDMTGDTRVIAINAGFPIQNAQLSRQDQGVDNMIDLNHLHEAALLRNLKKRFRARMPYTYTGDICLAVNPYQWLDELYAPGLSKKYLQARSRRDLPPHVYAVSVAAFRHMCDHGTNQSILVSGESGAGKTETTKILMDNLAIIASAPSTGVNDHEQSITTRIIQVNPLLESFGNAKTTRNDNSSRFGKFTQLQFDGKHALCGAQCETYLLEKTRVICHERGERNYHIFYQLLHGTTRAERDSLGLGDDAPKFAYLEEKEPQLENRRGQKLQRSQSPVLKSAASVEAETLKDQSLLKKTKQALSLLGLNAKQQNELFQVLAGILHLGEARFVIKCDNDEACELDMDSVAYSSILLGLLPETMAKALTHRTMKAAGEIYLVPLTVEQAQSGRDALAKAIYASIFDWLVAGINASLGAKAQQTTSTIGVLDIFGFESFEHNSFEQLCINYANEKLQQKFTQDVFRSVQEEYEREQITWAHIAYADNSETLALIESRMGLLALLNEEIVRPRGHEEGFVSKLSSAYCKHKTLIEFPRISKTQFAIHHYAGTVLYDATGFLEKHKDALLTDLSDLMCQSHEPFPQMLFQVRKEMEAAAPKHPLSSLGIRKAGADRTVGMQFKKSLNALMTTINDTNVNYIRCIKPNCRKSASLLEDKMVATQLRCAGVIEAICIARVGYPNRLVHGEFAAQFDLFLTKEQQQQLQNDPKTYGVLCCRDVVEQFHLETPEEYQMGQSKIYLQKGVLETLEYAKAQKLYAYVARIQARWRGMRARVEYCNQRIAVRMIQRRVRVFIARRHFQRARVALALIQRVWRGYVGRCAFCSVRNEHFALEMQRVWRGHQGRQVFRAVLKQTRAVRLQCCVRQYFARKELLQRRMERYNQHERERMARELEMLRQRKRAEEQERQKQLEKERVRLADEQRREEARRMKSLRIKSAVVIQTNARGYFARCGFAEMQQFAKDEACRVKEELEQERLRCLQREQEEQEVRRLAAANAAREKKRAIEERKRKAMAMRQRREKAVTGIQRIFRGFSTRKDIQTMREAAILVQRVSRGYVARKRVKYLENEMCEKEVKAKEVAALGLPSIQRGRLVRQHCSRIRVESKAQEEDVVVALTMRLNAKNEELQRVCDENARLRDEVAALQKSSRDLQSVVADYENNRSIDKTLMHSLDTPCLELENRRGEYSAACNFFANSGSSRRSTEPDELNSSDNFSETSSNYGEEDCNNWKEDRPTMNSLASSYFNGDRPSTDIAKLLSRSQTRTTRLATAMQQRRQKVSQIVQQRKQPSMLHRKDLNAQRMDQNELQTSVSKPKKWATFSRTKFSKKEKHKPLSPIEF